MATKKSGRRAKVPAAMAPGTAPGARPNPRVQAQTRRVLVQHYRAKYGVK